MMKILKNIYGADMAAKLYLLVLLLLISCGGDSITDELNRNTEQISWRLDRIKVVIKEIRSSGMDDLKEKLNWNFDEIESADERIGKEVDDVINSVDDAGNFKKSEIDDVRVLVTEMLTDIEKMIEITTSDTSKPDEDSGVKPGELKEKLLSETDKFKFELSTLKSTLDKLNGI